MQSTVRSACLEDAGAIVALLPDLGYGVEFEQVHSRLHKLLRSRNHVVLVAEANGSVAGLCLAGIVRHLASSGYAEVFELVVEAKMRRQGLGTLLLKHVQAWAEEQGLSRVRLRSGLRRTEAHQFYEQLGYAKSRASYAFELTLGQAGSNPSVKVTPISELRPLAAAPCVER
jgi:GNAT superfamily N-acetyltransferase